jgi:hypothetical protein
LRREPEGEDGSMERSGWGGCVWGARCDGHAGVLEVRELERV